MNSRQTAITRAYFLRQRRLREEMLRRLELAYRVVREDDISATYEDRFVPVAARTITAAQSSAQTLTHAYLRGLGGGLVASPFLAGTSKSGTIALALVGIVPIILAAIKNGSAPKDALTLGAAHVTRTADNELTRVVDAETDYQAERGKYAGWIGHSYGSKDACVGNDGFHTFDVKMYRHPSCRCARELVPMVSFGPGDRVMIRGQISRTLVGVVVSSTPDLARVLYPDQTTPALLPTGSLVPA